MIPRFGVFGYLLILITILSISAHADTPNFVVIFVDDLGYGDLGCYGSPSIKTPCIDRLADEGILFTNFYVGSSVCSASRASLLTGRYSARHGVGGVFFPGLGGMNPQEITIAEMLKENGYATACFGKWHLGDDEQYLPTNQGFDEYFGIPYSNDMYIGPKQQFAEEVTFNKGYTLEQAVSDQEFVRANLRARIKIKKERALADLVPIMDGEEIVEYPAEQSTLTQRYFDRTIQFIEKRDCEEPFFVYLTPTMPHIPLFASPAFQGKSERGLYGDVVEEIDWNVGRLLDFLDKSGLSENTFVIFASDNGPWLGKGDHGGSAGALREGKFTNYEGGVRVPAIVRWPGVIPKGERSDEIVSTIDLLPTFAHYSGANLPNVKIDGLNVAGHFENPQSTVERDGFLYLQGGNIIGVRADDWKYMPQSGKRNSSPADAPELFNLTDDVSEERNRIDQETEVLDSMITLFDTIVERSFRNLE